MAKDINKLKEQIRLMLAKAESTTFEAERDTFNAAAEKMMLRLGITIAELEASGERKAEKIVEVKRTYGGNYSISLIPFVHYVAEGFGHLTVLQSNGYKLEKNAYIIGHESDVEQFLVLLDSLMLQVMSALKAWQRENIEYRRGLTDMQKYLQHRSFIEGFGSKVGRRLREARKVEEATVAVGSGTELVLVSKDAKVQSWVDETYPSLKATASRRSHSSLGWAAGHVAGDSANLGQTQLGNQQKLGR